MLALYRSGRQADALDAYQAARRTLDDELGLEPGPELRELEAAILRHDAATVARRLGRVADEAAVERTVEHGVALVVRGDARSSRAAVGASLLSLLLRDGSTPLTVPPGSVAAIDPRTNEVVAVVPVGPRPGPIADGAGSLWVGNLEDRTLTRIDPRDGRILGTIALPATPTGDRRRLRTPCGSRTAAAGSSLASIRRSTG